MITFANPLFLFGLAAGILPILIHRLTQRKARVRKFSAVRLLLQSQQNLVRPERLRQFLLLALRVLAVLSLALLMARPAWLLAGVFSPGDAGARILVLDDSLSMGYREDRGVRFDLAKAKAREILAGVTGRVLVLPASTGRPGPPPGWMTPDQARGALDAIGLTFGRGDTVAALNRASPAWRDARGPVELVILTDLARPDWEGFRLSELKEAPADLSITFLRFGAEGRDPNVTVRGMRLAQGDAVAGAANRLEANVLNLSGEARSVLAQFYLDGAKVEQKTVELQPGEEGPVSFDLFLEHGGWVNGEVRLAEDRLAADDRFHFALKARDRVRVLVVDGDPRPSPQGSESYYLLNALQPGRGEGSPFLVRALPEGELERADLTPYDAVFLLNVPRPPASPVAAFLKAGKPVFLFLGDRVDPRHYGRLPFLPWRLGEVRGFGPRGPSRIGRVDFEGEPLRSLAGAAVVGWKKAAFLRYFRIEGSSRDRMALENGDPLLVEGASAGGGRVFLFASSADLDWNDLPLHALYLPWIQGLLKDAVGLSASPLQAGLRLGEPSPESGPDSQLTGVPGGPGVYRFDAPEGEVRRGLNPPPEESDLRKMTPEEMQKRFGSVKVRVVEAREDAPVAPLVGRRELWPYLLGFLLLVLGVEMGVASRV